MKGEPVASTSDLAKFTAVDCSGFSSFLHASRMDCGMS
jgi:hypothetical protein